MGTLGPGQPVLAPSPPDSRTWNGFGTASTNGCSRLGTADRAAGRSLTATAKRNLPTACPSARSLAGNPVIERSVRFRPPFPHTRAGERRVSYHGELCRRVVVNRVEPRSADATFAVPRAPPVVESAPPQRVLSRQHPGTGMSGPERVAHQTVPDATAVLSIVRAHRPAVPGVVVDLFHVALAREFAAAPFVHYRIQSPRSRSKRGRARFGNRV